MKPQSLVFVRTISLLCLIQFCFSFQLGAQESPTAHKFAPGCSHSHDDTEQENTPVPRPALLHESSNVVAAIPNVEVTFGQEEAGKLLYHTVAGWNGSSAKKAQLSLRIWIKNIEPSLIFWDKVVFQYSQNGVMQTKTFSAGLVPVAPNAKASWQNSRDYGEEGDVIFLNSPLPTSLTVKLYFFNYSSPLTITKPLGAYTQTFGMPFRAYDLTENEVWESGSTHGGGAQVYAYDMGVYGYNDGWSNLLPGKDGTQNNHHRVWGKPVYAMADGVIVESSNNCPNNPTPGEEADYSGFPSGKAGNHFYIQHGENIVLYAHMIQSSLNQNLLAVGSIVKPGDFLGLAGNSGQSSGPHLHIHVRKETEPDTGPFRPLLFNTGWAIEKSSFPMPVSSANWFELTAHGLPGKGDTRAFIWPSGAKPKYNDRIYTGVWRLTSNNQAIVDGVIAPVFITNDNTYQNQGMRLSELSVVNDNGQILYSGSWRAGSNASKMQLGTSYAAFKSEYDNIAAQGYRLLDLEVFRDANNTLRYAGIYGFGLDEQALHADLTWAAFQSKKAELDAQDYRLVDLEMYKNNAGSLLYAGVWRKLGGGISPTITALSWDSFESKWGDMVADGFRLADLDTEYTPGGIYYMGVFIKTTGKQDILESNWNTFYATWEDHYHQDGLQLADFNVRMKSSAAAGGDNSADRAALGEGAENAFGPVALKIFPNPTSDQFTIQTEANILDWSLYNPLGQIVRNGKAEGSCREIVIPVTTLTADTYYLSISTDKGLITKQVNVAH